MIGFTRPKHGDLSHAEPMGHVVFNQHFTEPVGGRQRINIAVVVIRPNLGDDGDLARGVEGFTFPVAAFDDR